MVQSYCVNGRRGKNFQFKWPRREAPKKTVEANRRLQPETVLLLEKRASDFTTLRLYARIMVTYLLVFRFAEMFFLELERILGFRVYFSGRSQKSSLQASKRQSL